MWTIVGHQFAVELFQRSTQTRQISHAYLLAGTPNIGKTTLAQTLAQALNCASSPDGSGNPPCGVCRSCRLIQAGHHPDVQVIAPENDHIKIEAIRDMQAAAALSPVEGLHRVFVIGQIDTATPSAANCLLKTLEEPPEPVVIILTADRLELVLPTIVSRCQVINLRPLSSVQVASALRARGVESEKAELLGRLSQGRIGWAISAAQDQHILEQRKQLIEKLVELSESTYVQRFAYAEQLSAKPDQIPHLLQVMSSWWHDIMVMASGSAAPITNIDQQSQLTQWAARIGADAAARMLRNVYKTAWRLERNANPRLTLEVLMLDMPSAMKV